MKKQDDTRILVDLDRFAHASFEELPVAFEMTAEERASFPNLLALDDFSISAKISAASDYYTVSLNIRGVALVKDAHDGATRTLNIDDGVDVVIAPHDEEASDLLPDGDGEYDLRPAILALLYDAIPDSYSEVPLTKVVTDDFVLMSEEEYQAIQAKKNNPFAHIDVEDKGK